MVYLCPYPLKSTDGFQFKASFATRYDKLAANFLAATALVGVLYWIKLRVQTLIIAVVVILALNLDKLTTRQTCRR